MEVIKIFAIAALSTVAMLAAIIGYIWLGKGRTANRLYEVLDDIGKECHCSKLHSNKSTTVYSFRAHDGFRRSPGDGCRSTTGEVYR